MMDLFRHLRIHTKKKDAPEEMDFPEMYLMGLQQQSCQKTLKVRKR